MPQRPASTLPGAGLLREGGTVLHLSIYVVNDVVVWRLWKPRPAAQWRTLGPSYWERRGEVVLDEEDRTDRQLLTAALAAIQARLGER